MSNENKYYVYEVTLKGETIYIGKGKGNRVKHVLSGKSHNRGLNEYVFRHELLSEDLPSVRIVQYFSEERDALKYEEFLIRDRLPECNIRLCTKTGKVKDKNNKKKGSFKSIKLNKDTLFTLPTNYPDFCEYIESLHSDSQDRGCVTSLRSFVYSKKFSSSWKEVLPWLERFLEELPDNRENNGGHNIDDMAKDFCLDRKERKKLNNFKAYYKSSRGVPPSEDELLAKITKIRSTKK